MGTSLSSFAACQQGSTQPMNLRVFKAELRGPSVNLSGFLVILRGFRPGF